MANQSASSTRLDPQPVIRTFVTRVARVQHVSPTFRRLTFRHEAFRDMVPAGAEQFLYVLLPPPGTIELTIDEDFTWEQYQEMAPERRPVGAYYTVRNHRPEAAEVDLDFVLHGDSGNASGWAARARVGDPVALWGPRSSYEPPVDTQWMLLVADETGLPAVAGILDSVPAGVMVRAFVEVDSEDDRQALTSAANFHVTWVYRRGAEPGTVPERLVEAVREMRWPTGNGYAWGGGESRAVTMVRRYVRHVQDMPRERVSIIPYWRHSSHPDDVREDD